MLESKFSRLVSVYVLWTASWIFAGGFFDVYFFGQGMSLQELFLADTLIFVASMFTIPLFRGFKCRDSMVAGIAVSIICVLILFLSPAKEAAYAFRLISGITHILFWVPFNTLYYEFRKENHAVMGALYYAISPVLSLVLPALAGLLALTMGFQALFILAMISLAVTALMSWFFVENRAYSYDFITVIKSFSGLRSIIFMEGFTAAVITGVTLVIMPLLYVKGPLEFGVLISLSTIFAVLASLVTAKLSDNMKRRREFLLPVVGCFALAVIFTSRSWDLLTFFIGLGLVNFFSKIFFPLPLALAVDNTKSRIVDSMVGREFMLNFGRLAGALLGCLVFVFSDIQTVLLLEGIALLAYIPIFENRKRKLTRH
jgi:predicted MFS family arabinose efflux permease